MAQARQQTSVQFGLMLDHPIRLGILVDHSRTLLRLLSLVIRLSRWFLGAQLASLFLEVTKW